MTDQALECVLRRHREKDRDWGLAVGCAIGFGMAWIVLPALLAGIKWLAGWGLAPVVVSGGIYV